jgi:uncharacterized protein (TIGR02058 family)
VRFSEQRIPIGFKLRGLFTFRLQSTTSSWKDVVNANSNDRPTWSEEWKALGLGATLVDNVSMTNLLFVELGFGVDQHGSATDATKAAVRAVRNAIEFNSIPGVIEAIPGGRREMLIHVKLGVPSYSNSDSSSQVQLPSCDVMQVAKVFPYGKLLPIEVEHGGLSFSTGRVVEELGDTSDVGICVAACISIGYNDGSQQESQTTYSTKDGY